MNSDNIKADFIDIYKDAAAEILQNGILELKEPTEEQIKNMKYKITMQKIEEKTTMQEVESLLKHSKYSKLSKDDKDFVMNKVNSEWSNLSRDEIILKVKKIVENLI